MPQLIIGHTTDQSACIWVRGDFGHPRCEIKLDPPMKEAIPSVRVSRDADYTATLCVNGLRPGTRYTVTATFGTATEQGRFTTLHRQTLQHNDNEKRPIPFSFILSSCNLSTVSINNLLAFLGATAGTSAAVSSLDLPADRWRHTWGAPFRSVLKGALGIVAKIVYWFTDLRQPPPPYLRSPFLKLSAVFEAHLVDVSAKEECLPAVGETVFCVAGSGVLASAPAQPQLHPPETTQDPPKWRLVLTHVKGDFKRGDALFKRSPRSPDDEKKAVGCVVKSLKAKPWYRPPAFFIHAGDQIYYDFPTEGLAPKRDNYRRAYREAFFDDYGNRHLLAHWPHYMIWDDHELADQFALDFNPPDKKSTASTYFTEAAAAYREYVDVRNPPEPERTESLWYRFENGCTRFFVLDTRSARRRKTDKQLIDRTQMQALLKWMKDYKSDLKFIVTSVPFVAEVRDDPNPQNPTWNRGQSPEAEGNPVNDKWNADEFRHQREEIMTWIFDNAIERVVFLTGDMHCCYHATMRIGELQEDGSTKKYESVTVHELASGPMNQLQLATIQEFHTRHASLIGDRLRYSVVMEQLHTQVNAVMHIRVKHPLRDDADAARRRLTPEVEWNVIRTLTDTGALAWTDVRKAFAADVDGKTVRVHEPVMGGRISFFGKRA